MGEVKVVIAQLTRREEEESFLPAPFADYFWKKEVIVNPFKDTCTYGYRMEKKTGPTSSRVYWIPIELGKMFLAMQTELASAKEELHEAREVIGFYSDDRSWTGLETQMNYDRVSQKIVFSDCSEEKQKGYLKGGKRAREFMRKYGVGK